MKTTDRFALYGSVAGAALLWLMAKKKNSESIGKVHRIKRRIYKEVSLAQQAGIDFTKKYADLTTSETEALIRIGEEVGWKQSKRAAESGKPYAESYYNSLRRAWNAVSGISGIGTTYKVKDANGNVVLTWIEDAQAHVDAERRTLDVEKRTEEARKRLKKNQRALAKNIAPAPAPKTKKAKKASYEERYEFAQMIWDKFLKENEGLTFNDEMKNPDSRVEHFKYIHNLIADAFARKRLKLKNKKGYGKEVFAQIPNDEKWYLIGRGWVEQYVSMLLNEEKIASKTGAWEANADGLNTIRKELLDTAKHMQVVVYDDGREIIITGEDRYKHLDAINYVVMVQDKTMSTGETTIYPIRAFEDEELAQQFADWWKGKQTLEYRDGFIQTLATRTCKVVPVFDVNIKAITGIGYPAATYWIYR